MPKFLFPGKTTDKTVYLHELTQKDYKNFSKTIINNDINCLNIFVNELLEELAYNKEDIKNLDNIDKLLLLLDIRNYCISPIIEFKESNKSYEIDLNDVISAINNIDYQKYFLYKDNNIFCKASLPQQLIYNKIEDMFADCLIELKINNEIVNIDFNNDKKRQIVDRLPPQLLGNYTNYVNKTNSILQKTVLIDIPPEIAKQTFYLSSAGEEIIQLIGLCFYLDLSTTYQNEYQLVRNFKFTSNQINCTVPAELNLYYKFVKDEIRESKKDDKPQGTYMPSKFGVD